jgi:hypothetical protein
MSDGRLPTRRRTAGWIVAAIVALLLFAIGWVVVRGFGAVSELQNAQRSVAQLHAAIDENAFERAERVAPRIAQHAELARDLSADPIWRAFEFAPWLGQNLTAIREVASISGDAADDAVRPIVRLAPDVDLASLGLSGSRVDLTVLPGATDTLADAASVLAEADAKARLIDLVGLLPPIADAVRQARATLGDAASAVGALHDASLLLPGMLGGSEPRTYVLAVQNNAELRAHGGTIAAFLQLRAADGAISIERAVSGRDLPALTTPLDLDDAVLELYGDGPGRIARDMTSVPDFASAAALVAQRWQSRFDIAVDGVVAVDIQTMRHVLSVTDRVEFDAFTATSKSIASVLTSEVPQTLPDPAAQEVAFSRAAQAVLEAALSAQKPAALLSALSDAARDDRLRIWSAHAEEQEVLAASALGGALPADRENEAHVGVLVDDRTDAPLDAYATTTISTALGTCDGAAVTQVRVTWTNDVPDEVAASAPAPPEGDPGSTRTLIAIYGPEGASAREGAAATLDGRPVVQHEVALAPGETATVTATFTGAGSGERLTHLHHTPMLDDPESIRADVDCG